MRHLLACASLGLGLAFSPVAQGQAFLPFGFTSLPSFAWPREAPEGLSTWEGAYGRLSSGFQVSSSRRFGTAAGPTIGFEGGRMWREGDVVFGIVGAVDYLAPYGGYAAPSFGRMTYTRDFAGALQVKAGTFVADNVLLYTKAGFAAVNETLRFGATPISQAFSRENIAVRPDARVGVEWAVTDRLTLGIEAGVTGHGIR